MDGLFSQRRIYRSNFAIVTGNAEPQDDDVELSLGLSLNGRFGLNPTRKRLRRSSSVSDLFPRVVAYDNGLRYRELDVWSGSNAVPLTRASSLPAETEETRRRRELQVRKSLEARRKRMAKMRNGRGTKPKEGRSGDNHDGNGLNGGGDQRVDGGIGRGFENSNQIPPPPGFEGLAGNGIDGPHELHPMEGVQLHPANPSLPFQVPAKDGEQVQAAGQGRPRLDHGLFDMPFVSTRGHGPNQVRIQGFLYKYNSQENIKIVCVCHGLFLSPAEFLKHGGESDAVAAEPLKHIVMLTFPFP